MEITLTITHKKTGYRAGKVYIDGKYFCYSIEDEDRGLTSAMSLEEIAHHKKYGITAIPTGRYEVAMTYSNRFKRYMPQVLSVKGYEGIRIHVANTAKDVEGCIGLAYEDSSDGFAGNSKNACVEFERRIKAVEKKEKIFITIK